MKKKYQLIIIALQAIISLIYILSSLFVFIDNLRFNSPLINNSFNFISIFIQLIVFFILSVQIYQMNEPQRNSSSTLFLLVLMTLSLDGVILLPDLFIAINQALVSPIIIGKIHIFSIISSALLLILCGINQNEKNTKNINFEIVFSFAISTILTYIININTPLVTNERYMLITSQSFKVFFIIFILLEILSFIPSYLKDKTQHNKLKTYSFIFFSFSFGLLKYSINTSFLIQIIALIILIASSIVLVINLKSYSI